MTNQEALNVLCSQIQINVRYTTDFDRDYKCLCKCKEALEKQVQKKPLYFDNEAYLCPCCKRYNFYRGTEELHKMNYCAYCGQAIDWSKGE